MAKKIPSALEEGSAAASFIEQTEATGERKVGQPRKYNEPTRSISFKLPLSAIEALKDLAFVEHTNTTQIILALIKQRSEEKKQVLAALKAIKQG